MSKNKKRLKRIESLLEQLVQAANKNSTANREVTRRLEIIERSLSFSGEQSLGIEHIPKPTPHTKIEPVAHR